MSEGLMAACIVVGYCMFYGLGHVSGYVSRLKEEERKKDPAPGTGQRGSL